MNHVLDVGKIPNGGKVSYKNFPVFARFVDFCRLLAETGEGKGCCLSDSRVVEGPGADNFQPVLLAKNLGKVLLCDFGNAVRIGAL